MRKRLAKILIITGIVCVLASLSLFIYNKAASNHAAEFAERIVNQIQDQTGTTDTVPDDRIDYGYPGDLSDTPEGDPDADIPYTVIEEYEFIGYLSIPTLRLDLPVMADWSYDRLNISPCRYSGSPATDDLVIAAHNYSSHFGFISSLNIGDAVSFIDVHNEEIDYKVELIDTLSPTAVEDMTAGDYDLTLFTCTYSGQARVTVRLNRIQE